MAFVPGAGSFGGSHVPSSPRGVKPTDTYFSNAQSFNSAPSVPPSFGSAVISMSKPMPPPQSFSSMPPSMPPSMAMPPPQSYSSMPGPPVKSEMFVPGSGALAPQTFQTSSIGVSMPPPPQQSQFIPPPQQPQTIIAPTPTTIAPVTETIVAPPQASFKTETIMSAPPASFKTEMFASPSPGPGMTILPPSQPQMFVPNSGVLAPETILPAPQAYPTSFTETFVPSPATNFKTESITVSKPNYEVPPAPIQSQAFVPNSGVLAPPSITTLPLSEPTQPFPPASPRTSMRQYSMSQAPPFIPGSQAILPAPSTQNVSYQMPQSMPQSMPYQPQSMPQSMPYQPQSTQSMPYQMPQSMSQSMPSVRTSTPRPPVQSMPQSMPYRPPPPKQKTNNQPIYTKGGATDEAAVQHLDEGLTSFLPGAADFAGQIEDHERFISRRNLGYALPNTVVLEDRKDDDWYEDAADLRYMNDPNITAGHAWYDREAEKTQMQKRQYLPDAYGYEAQAMQQNPEHFSVRPYMGMLEIEGRDDREDNCRLA